MFFNMYIAPGQGQTTFVDKILMATEKPCHFAHLLQVSKNVSLKFDFIHNFSCYIHIYSPGTGADNPLGSEFLYNK